MTRQVIIPAGGMGERLGEALPKALVPLCGIPLLVRTLSAFLPLGLADTAVVTIPAGHESSIAALLEEAFPDNHITLVPGGVERQDSVRNALAALRSDTELVAIHDAARPFVTGDAVEASFEAAARVGAATVAVPAIDTILVSDGDGYLSETPDRSTVWYCQTPQTFQVAIIREAHETALRKSFQGTDDATLVRRCGQSVKLVRGDFTNLKVTTPTDMIIAETFIEKNLVCV